MVDHSKLELFNKKHAGQSQGTLVGNWWEERELRLVTDVGRTNYQRHIPKTRDTLFLLPPEEMNLNDTNHYCNTSDRIFCEKFFNKFIIKKQKIFRVY